MPYSRDEKLIEAFTVVGMVVDDGDITRKERQSTKRHKIKENKSEVETQSLTRQTFTTTPGC
jgi:hypothetical protein